MAKPVTFSNRNSPASVEVRLPVFSSPYATFGGRGSLVVLRSAGISSLILVLVVLVLLPGCVADKLDNSIPDSDAPVVTVASTTQIEILQAALTEGVVVADAYAVRSESHEWAHYVAARLTGVDGDDIGLWLMFDGMDIPGARYSANAVASTHSGFPRLESVSNQSDAVDREISVLMRLVGDRRSAVYP